MPKLTDSFAIAAPVQAVWDTSVDLHAWEEVSDVKIDKLTGVDDFTVGTGWRETRRFLGRDSAQEWEVTLVEPPTRFTCVSTSMGSRWVYDMFFVPDGTGTRVIFEFVITPQTAASRLTFPFTWPLMAAMMRRGISKEYAKFAELCVQRARASRT